jgi:hypothetical protein
MMTILIIIVSVEEGQTQFLTKEDLMDTIYDTFLGANDHLKLRSNSQMKIWFIGWLK